MKVLLIGGSGYIGTHLAPALELRGWEVLVGYRDRAPVHMLGTRKLVRLTLEDTAAIRDLLDREKPDAVVHLASRLVPGSGAAEYLDERTAIIDPTARLLFSLTERGTKIIFASSGGAIYGRGLGSAFTEESDCRPISYYGQSKLEIEGLIRFVHRTAGLPYLIVRPSNPYGGSQSLKGRQGFIGAALGCLLDGRPLQIWGDGKVVRDFIHIDDLCASIAQLAELDLSADTINIGSGVGHSLLDVVGAIEGATGRALRIDFGESRAADVPSVVLDVSRARDLGIPPARSLQDGIGDYVKALGAVHVR